jgi:hypothetical protein
VKTVWALASPVTGKSAALATMIDAQTNPCFPLISSFRPLTHYQFFLLGRCFHAGWPLYKQLQRLRVPILGSVPFQTSV